MNRPSTLIAMLVAAYSVNAAADPLNICVPKKAGSIRVAPKCKSSEIQKTIDVGGPPSSSGMPHLYDANGQDLGTLMDDSDYNKILITALGVTAHIYTNGIVEDTDGFVGEELEDGYVTNDCSGVAYYHPPAYFYNETLRLYKSIAINDSVTYFVLKKKLTTISGDKIKSRALIRAPLDYYPNPLPSYFYKLYTDPSCKTRVACGIVGRTYYATSEWDLCTQITLTNNFLDASSYDKQIVTLPFTTPVKFPLHMK